MHVTIIPVGVDDDNNVVDLRKDGVEVEGVDDDNNVVDRKKDRVEFEGTILLQRRLDH